MRCLISSSHFVMTDTNKINENVSELNCIVTSQFLLSYQLSWLQGERWGELLDASRQDSGLDGYLLDNQSYINSLFLLWHISV